MDHCCGLGSMRALIKTALVPENATILQGERGFSWLQDFGCFGRREKVRMKQVNQVTVIKSCSDVRDVFCY